MESASPLVDTLSAAQLLAGVHAALAASGRGQYLSRLDNVFAVTVGRSFVEASGGVSLREFLDLPACRSRFARSLLMNPDDPWISPAA